MNTAFVNKLSELIDKQQHMLLTRFHNTISTINNTITFEQACNIYNIANSLRNSNVSVKGRLFEKCVEQILIYYKFNYKAQVSINISNGVFQTGHKQPVVDFVVAKHGCDIIGMNVSDCVILSCKQTCRERCKQDDCIKRLHPLCYMLLVGSNDYPKHMIDDEHNKMITLQPKPNDERLTFDNFIDILNEYVGHEQRPIRYIDLCCGMGSFHYSFDNNNIQSECVMACDIDKYAKQYYINNYPNTTLLDDVNDIDFNKYDVDVVFSGNPCQSFSQIGKRNGLDDERGNLFEVIINNVIGLHKYPIVVFENVHGLLTHDNGNTFAYIINKIQQHGYKTYHRVLLCSNYGIPQNRKRVFVICYNIPNINNDIVNNIMNNVLNKYSKHITLTDYLNNGLIFQKDTAYTIRCGGCNSPITSKQNWDGYYVVDNDNQQFEYRLTVDDMCKLQGFANCDFLNIPITQQKHLLGNTIPTNLTSIIIDVVVSMLAYNNKDVCK